MNITLNCTFDRSVQVDAHVFGEWAAHPGVDHDLSPRRDWWVVTHVPSGRTILKAVGPMGEEQAIALASAMGERLPLGLIPSLSTEDAGAELPPATKQLIRSVIRDVRGEVLT